MKSVTQRFMGSRLGKIGEYWDMRAEGYSEDVLGSIGSGNSGHWVDIVGEYLEGNCLRILDVGTGPGFFPLTLGALGHNVTGIDWSEGMLEKARCNCERAGVAAEFRRMDAQHIDFDDGTFDIVVSRNLVWNLEDPVGAYAEWLRVLKDGGKLMVFDGNHYLHLFDESFAEALGPESDHRRHHDLRGVDPSIIEGIARELPLSSRRRPQWDADTLMELGVQKLTIETDGRDSYRLTTGGRTVYIPFSFFVCAVK